LSGAPRRDAKIIGYGPRVADGGRHAANAVCDALSAFGVEVNTTPADPEQLLRAVSG
jgi:hypothetical protein